MLLLPIIFIPIAIVAAIIYMFSPSASGWFVWSLVLLVNSYLLLKSFLRYSAFRKGETLSANELVLISSTPFSTSLVLLFALSLLFLDFSKLHLLWICPLLAVAFEFTIGMRTSKKLEELGGNATWRIEESDEHGER